MNKIVALLLSMVMLLSVFPVCAFAEDVTANEITTEVKAVEKATGKSKVVADLSGYRFINGIGMPASDLYRKSGEYTMELSGSDLLKKIKVPCDSDWSESNTLQMWVYCPNVVTSEISIALISDNAETPWLDYYVASFSTGVMGWSLVSLMYQGESLDFTPVNSPKGFDSIDRIEIWPSHNGNVPASGTQVYFDRMTISYQEKKVETSVAEKDEELVLFKNVNIGSKEQSFGKPPISDWSGYNTLGFRIYSPKATGRGMRINLMKDMPETSGADYYYFYLPVDWEGWKTIEYDIRDGGGIARGGQPDLTGWTGFTEVTKWNHSNTRVETLGIDKDNLTEIQIEKMYLVNRDYDSMFLPEGEDYLIEAHLDKDFEDYASKVKERYNGDNAHPRLLFNAEKLERMKSLIVSDTYMIKSYAKLLENADKAISNGPQTEASSEMTLCTVALAYNLSGEQKYADWVWESMKNLSVNALNWNPNNHSFLSTGDTMASVAFTYDWMYNHWTDEQRRIARNAMVHFGAESTFHYARSYDDFGGNKAGNWTQIVLRGLGLTGLAIAGEDDKYNDLCNEMINRAIVGLTFTHEKTISADGSYIEGPSYWKYGMGEYLPFLSALYDTTGTTGGLMELPGMRNVGDYPIGLAGPQGLYNYADGASSSSEITAGGMFFISKYFNDPKYSAYHLQFTQNGGDLYSMCLYEPSEENSNYLDYMPKYTYFTGQNEVLTIRKSWTDNNATFLGIKAGDNGAGHGQHDIGSFVYDQLGVRWAHELGRDSYLWDKYPEGKQAFYRNRAEGQNALVINPNEGPQQNPNARCVINEHQVLDNVAYAVIDLTEAYEDMGATSVKRGYALLNNYGSLIIQDEIKSSKPVEVYSFMHTKADIEISSDGKSAVLTQNGQKLRVRLISSGNAKLLNMAADPLPKSPNPKENYSRAGLRKLAVHVESEKSPTITLLLTPYVENEAYEFKLNDITPLRSFKNYTKNPVSVNNMYLDGVPLQGFDSNVSNYVLNEYEVGEITCDVPSGTRVEIKQAEKLGDTAFIVVTSEKTNIQSVYSVTFSNQIQSMMDMASYNPIEIDASAGKERVLRVIDGDVSTDWSVNGPNWISFDFGSPKLLKEIKLKWYLGAERYAYYKVEVSDDKLNWKTVFDGQSQMSDDFETTTFAETTARYLRVFGNGNSNGTYTSIEEMRVTSYEDSFTDIAGHWAYKDIQNLANMALISTKDSDRFEPEKNITRAEFVTLMQSVLGLGGITYSGRFADVSESDSFANGLEGAYILGIVPPEMIADGNFYPNNPITCQEMIAIATLACNIQKGYTEYFAELDSNEHIESVSPEYVKYMKNAKAMKLLGGSLSDNEIFGTMAATKAQAAVIAKRVYVKIY